MYKTFYIEFGKISKIQINGLWQDIKTNFHITQSKMYTEYGKIENIL